MRKWRRLPGPVETPSPSHLPAGYPAAILHPLSSLTHGRGLRLPSHPHLLRFLRPDFFFFFFPRAGSGARPPSHEGLRRGGKKKNKRKVIKIKPESAHMGLLSLLPTSGTSGAETSVFTVDLGCRQVPNYALTNNLVTV